MPDKPLSYWNWFFRGRTDSRPGWRQLMNGWLLAHLVIGTALSTLVLEPLPEAAKAILLPLAGILIGMSFAWIGNAIALVQTPEIERLAAFHHGGIEQYVYTFQTAILVLLVTLSMWGAAGLGVFERPCFWPCGPWAHTTMSVILYALASLAIRECWQVVAFSQLLLLYLAGGSECSDG